MFVCCPLPRDAYSDFGALKSAKNMRELNGFTKILILLKIHLLLLLSIIRRHTMEE